MADKKKPKLDVTEAGQAAALKHNPFAGLTGASATAVPAGPSAEADLPSKSAEPPRAKARGRLVLRREKKGRGGKTVVVVTGLRADAHLPESEIAKLAQHLKQQLGVGGSVERIPNDSAIVVQGDQPARVAELLRGQGFRVDGVTE